jgi:hypothetical protein
VKIKKGGIESSGRRRRKRIKKIKRKNNGKYG